MNGSLTSFPWVAYKQCTVTRSDINKWNEKVSCISGIQIEKIQVFANTPEANKDII